MGADDAVATRPTGSARTNAIQVGRRIGKYEILRYLASGGMAEVYLARATGIEQFEKLCVLKRILPSVAGEPEFVRMLLDEARIAATLHHQNIVSVFDIGNDSGELFIAMEYLHGRDVSAITGAVRKRGQRLAEDQALSIVLGVCAGLHYAHTKTDEHDRPLNIVHRDVSPTNVVVTYDGGVKLVDFGLVQAEGRLTESRSGSLKGKLAYMSPEQCRAKPCDRRSDVFSLAIVLWELTTGQRLYTGECDYDYLCAILEHDPKRPSEVIADYSPVLEQIVMKGLSRDPDERYQSAEEMQLYLEEYCREKRLKVSSITLRRMMEELFADELKSWQTALRDNAALDHVLRSLASGSVHASVRTSEPMTVPETSPSVNKMVAERSSTRRKRRIAPWLAAVAIAAGGGAAGTYYALRDPATAPAAAAATTPTPSAKAETAPTPSPATEPAKSATTDSTNPKLEKEATKPPSDPTPPPPADPAKSADPKPKHVATTKPASDRKPAQPTKPASSTKPAPSATKPAEPKPADTKPAAKKSPDPDSLFPE